MAMTAIRWSFPDGNDTDALTAALAGADMVNVICSAASNSGEDIALRDH